MAEFSLLEYCAYHEAGHAVIAITHNIPFHYVILEETKKSYGRIEYIDTKDLSLTYEEKERYGCNRITTCLAGTSATLKQYGSSIDVENDEKKAREMIGEIDGSEKIESKFHMALGKTNKAVYKHWKQIETVAKELLQKQKLTEDEVRNIVNPIDVL